MNEKPLSRRRLLAGTAGLGATSIGGLAFFTSNSRAFTETTRLRSGAIDGLLLDWRETYNGQTLTNTANGTATSSPTGPVVSLGNVLPGDSGSLSVRIRPDTREESGADELSAALSLTFELTSEPRSPGLQEFVDAAMWYDTGLLGIDAFGARNGERDPGERLVHPDAEGTLGDVAAALEDGVRLDPSPNAPGTGCLEADGAITITFGWSFPPNQENINAVQGDTVEFDLRVGVEQCD